MYGRNPLLEINDPCRSCDPVGETDELQYCGNVGRIFRTNVRHRRRRIEVVTGVGHSETALEEKWHVPLRTVEVLCNPETEKVVGVHLRGIQYIDVRPQGAAEKSCELAAI